MKLTMKLTKKHRHDAVLWLYGTEMENESEEAKPPLVELVESERDALKAKCRSALTRDNWQRLPSLVQIILLVATAEITTGEGSKGRIISDYLNIARSYLEPSQLALINGVLDKID